MFYVHDLNLSLRNSVGQLLFLCPQVEYKYDKEMMKGCVIPVVDDKLILLAMRNAEMASDVSLFTLPSYQLYFMK